MIHWSITKNLLLQLSILYNLRIIMCQSSCRYCITNAEGCSSCHTKLKRRLNFHFSFCFYFSFFHHFWCATIFSLLYPLISFLPNQSPGEDIMFLKCERTLNLSTSFSLPLAVSANCAPSTVLLEALHLSRFLSPTTFFLSFKWDFHTSRNGKNPPVCPLTLPSTVKVRLEFRSRQEWIC